MWPHGWGPVAAHWRHEVCLQRTSSEQLSIVCVRTSMPGVCCIATPHPQRTAVDLVHERGVAAHGQCVADSPQCLCAGFLVYRLLPRTCTAPCDSGGRHLRVVQGQRGVRPLATRTSAQSCQVRCACMSPTMRCESTSQRQGGVEDALPHQQFLFSMLSAAAPTRGNGSVGRVSNERHARRCAHRPQRCGRSQQAAPLRAHRRPSWRVLLPDVDWHSHSRRCGKLQATAAGKTQMQT